MRHRSMGVPGAMPVAKRRGGRVATALATTLTTALTTTLATTLIAALATAPTSAADQQPAPQQARQAQQAQQAQDKLAQQKQAQDKQAQDKQAQQKQAPRAPARPVPRTPEGRVDFGPPAGETGVWERRTEHLVVNPDSYQANATRNARVHIKEVPLQPWARALTNFRHSLDLASEPYARCKASGGPRQLMSPYGLEIVQRPESGRLYIFNVANAQTFRTVYMDGRGHPRTLTPSYLGHSIGHWDGDTLVIDTIGFNESFWMNRDGLPHTSQLHLVERLTRTDFNTLDYEVTIDDPGAYTAPWKSGYTLGWSAGAEMFEYMCQQNNLSPESMVGDVVAVITP